MNIKFLRLGLLSLLLLGTAASSQAWIIYSRTTKDGGPRGYKQVSDQKIGIPYVDVMRVIHCTGPGIFKCPSLVDQTHQNHDVQEGITNLLLEFVQEQLNKGAMQGTEIRVFLDPVSGKKFRYTLVWNHQNLEDGTITIDKDELI
ncbi:MAG: hypothetical protein RL160_988 [Bacteroidota bacterium]|jgi:hypothetical protein